MAKSTAEIEKEIIAYENKVKKWYAEITEAMEWEATEFLTHGVRRKFHNFYESKYGTVCAVYDNGKVTILPSLHKPLKHSSLKAKLRRYRNG